MPSKYQLLLDSLKKAENDNDITLLYRGFDKKFAFERFNLDIKYNTLEQFAESLFFFGEKSKYFWNDKIRSNNRKLEFDINDISEGFFEFVFEEFNSLIKSPHYKGTSHYLKKNNNAILFFKDEKNMPSFVHAINQKSNGQKNAIRNYYLTPIHQLGKSKYKQTSQFISGSTDEAVANSFSRGEIVINFWHLNFSKEIAFESDNNIPYFKGKPYKNQQELSVFAVIFCKLPLKLSHSKV